MNGKIVAFFIVALLIGGLWFALGRNGEEAGFRTRFREWTPPK